MMDTERRAEISKSLKVILYDLLHGRATYHPSTSRLARWFKCSSYAIKAILQEEVLANRRLKKLWRKTTDRRARVRRIGYLFCQQLAALKAQKVTGFWRIKELAEIFGENRPWIDDAVSELGANHFPGYEDLVRARNEFVIAFTHWDLNLVITKVVTHPLGRAFISEIFAMNKSTLRGILSGQLSAEERKAEFKKKQKILSQDNARGRIEAYAKLVGYAYLRGESDIVPTYREMSKRFNVSRAYIGKTIQSPKYFQRLYPEIAAVWSVRQGHRRTN